MDEARQRALARAHPAPRETGHALDNAYRLRRRKRWRQVFGSASRPYPVKYSPRITSRIYGVLLGVGAHGLVVAGDPLPATGSLFLEYPTV